MDRKSHKDRILVEDALKLLIEAEQEGRAASASGLADSLGLAPEHAEALFGTLRGGGLLAAGGGPPRLTDAGRDYALQVLRAHRLYEAYLAQKTGLVRGRVAYARPRGRAPDVAGAGRVHRR